MCTEFEKLHVLELKAKLRAIGASLSGKKPDLVHRLVELSPFHAATAGEPTEPSAAVCDSDMQDVSLTSGRLESFNSVDPRSGPSCVAHNLGKPQKRAFMTLCMNPLMNNMCRLTVPLTL